MGKSTFRKENKRMRGLQLACRYSCQCEKAENLGFKNALKSFGSSNGSSEIDEKSIMSFLSHLEPRKYYDEIAQKNGIKSPFDIRVVKSYWRGVPELKGNLWHNLTTLFPIANLAIGQIRPKMVDECFVHPAQIIEVKGKKLLVEYSPVVIKDKELALSDKTTEKEIESIGYSNGFKKNDWVSMHFGIAVENLEPHDAASLLGISHKALDAFNSNRSSRK